MQNTLQAPTQPNVSQATQTPYADGYYLPPFWQAGQQGPYSQQAGGVDVVSTITQILPYIVSLFRQQQQGSTQTPGQQPMMGQQVPGQQVPGQQVPGQQVPGQQVPGQQVPGQQVNIQDILRTILPVIASLQQQQQPGFGMSQQQQQPGFGMLQQQQPGMQQGLRPQVSIQDILNILPALIPVIGLLRQQTTQPQQAWQPQPMMR